MAILVKSETDPADKNFWATNWFCLYDATRLYGRSFSFDVAAEYSTRKAAGYYSLAEGNNALELLWPEHWWCNPPFDDKAAFIACAVEQAKAGRGGMMLLPYEPLTDWWRELVACNATFIYEPDGRYNFKERDGITDKDGVNFGCALVLFTSHQAASEAVRIPFKRTAAGLGKKRIKQPTSLAGFPAFCDAIKARDAAEQREREFAQREAELNAVLAQSVVLSDVNEQEQHQKSINRMIRLLRKEKKESINV